MCDKETMLIGFDIYKFAKEWCSQVLIPGLDMTQEEAEAYEFGVDSALDIFCELVNVIPCIAHGKYKVIPVHIKGLKNMEEFLTIEEIEERLEQMERETL